MQLVKRSQQTIMTKSQNFREEYTSENTSRPSNTSRLNQQKQKRFKRNKLHNQNHSRSSSNCSESSSISRFYVKNVANLIPAEIFQNQSPVKNIHSNQSDQKQAKSPRKSTKNAFNPYGMNKDSNKQSPMRQTKEKKNESSIDISNFLRRQFSPPTPKNEIQPRKSIRNGLHIIQDSYNFLSPTSKRTYAFVEQSKTKDPKSLLQQLTRQRNRNAQLNLQLDKSKSNQKKLSLLNEQLELKAKRLTEKINSLEQQLSRSGMNVTKLKEENHKMKVLVKQRDSLMTVLMEKDKMAVGKREGINVKSSKEQSESLVSKVIEYEYENQKLRETINKLKKQLAQNQNNPSSSRTLLSNQTPPHLHTQQSITSSQITWDDRQFADCMQQKDRQILELREEIKNLQIEINYMNRKWTNEVERVRKIEKLEWMRLKDKYKELLMKYRDNVKMSVVLGPAREEVNRVRRERKRLGGVEEQENFLVNCQSPRRRKRNYTVEHLKGRGVMSDIRINYGVTKTGNPQDSVDLELLEYSSCDEELGVK